MRWLGRSPGKRTTSTGEVTSGNVSISQNGDVYIVKWSDTKSTVNGIGLISGDYLVVAFGGGNNSFGLLEYVFNGSSALGRTLNSGITTIGSETLNK